MNAPPTRHEIAAWVIMACALAAVLALHLLPALLGGLFVYELVHILAPRLRLGRGAHAHGKIAAVGVLAVAVALASGLALFGTIAFFRSDIGNLPALMKKMAEIIEGSRAVVPGWALDWLPADADSVKADVTGWLREHAGEIQVFGKEAGRALAHIVLGMIIGAMLSLHEAKAPEAYRPLARALVERCARLAESFRRIVFAQVRIAAINAALTAVYLAVLLPLAGVRLPLTKSMIAITFIAGLLPVLGNLISNTVIVVVSLSHSLSTAAASLVFLVVIHKLEYFLNARIVGGWIHARAWELLLAMLILEAAFGLPGLVAAPIYYAYLKDELSARGLV